MALCQCFENLSLYLETLTLEYRSGISFLSRQHKLSPYVFICLYCLLAEAATRVEVFVRKGVLKNSVYLTESHQCWSLFLINLQAWHLFWRTSVNDGFCAALAPLAVTYSFYFIFSIYRSSHWRCSVKKGVLRNFA